MKNIKTCELCLGHIIKTENLENLNCDEKQNLKLIRDLEIYVSRNANICSSCVNVSHLTYNFKTSCLVNNDHLKTLIVPGIKDKLILEQVIVKKTKSEFKHEEKVCRFCLNFSEVNSLLDVNLEQSVVLKDMLGKCLPEIDINIVQNPLICSICSELLKKLFNFISQCKDTKVLRNLDIKTDSVVNENKTTIANNNDNIAEIFVKEENCESLEDSELQIKSEDTDINEDIKDSSNYSLKEGEIHAKHSSSSSELIHHHTHWKTRKSTRRKLYKCTECLFQFNRQSNLVRHKNNDKKAYQCNMCSFTASNKCEIVKHKNIYQNLAGPRLFKCHKCPYITKRKRTLVLHNMRWHEDISKRPKYKCDECPYETIWRYALVGHKVTHQDPSEVKMYKCMMCLFETKRKSSLQRHEKIHARNQQNAVKVKQRRSNPVEEKDVKPKPCNRIDEKKFVCDICSFQTTSKYTLKQHYLIHKELSEVNVFKCDYCSFATKWKNSLTTHTIRHKNPSELSKFKCNDCPYETNKRSNLIRHVLMHKDPSEVNMFKCKVCPFQTKYRGCIQVHKRKHQVEVYTCDECDYKTNLKKSFLVHLRCHKEWKKPAKT